MQATLELTLKQYSFGSIYFPLSSASKANLQPKILLPTNQPLIQHYIYAFYTKECITLYQGAHNTTPSRVQCYTKLSILLHFVFQNYPTRVDLHPPLKSLQ